MNIYTNYTDNGGYIFGYGDCGKTLSDEEMNIINTVKKMFCNTIGDDMMKIPKPTRIIFNKPYTIVMFADGTKQIVKCSDDAEYSEYEGFVCALAVKMFGNNSNLKKFIEKHKDKQKECKKEHKNTTGLVRETIDNDGDNNVVERIHNIQDQIRNLLDERRALMFGKNCSKETMERLID